jgi:hypothetical protein
VPDRTGKPGRRAAWCSKACRQAAWRARTAAERAGREAAEICDRVAGDAYSAVQAAGGALAAAVLEMCEQGDVPVDVALRTGPRWERDVAEAARSLAAAATRVAELADAHAARAADYHSAHAVIRRAPASSAPSDGNVATTAAEASATKQAPTPPAPANAAGDVAVDVAVDVDDLFDAIEDVLDAKDVPGIPQDVLAGEEDVPGTSYVDALQDLADAHAAASGDGPHSDLVAAATAAVRSRPPYLPARVEMAMDRLAAVLPS